MKVVRHSKAALFLDRAAPSLLEAEAENSLVLGISHSLSSTPPGAGTTAPYLATVEAAGRVVACAVRTPPHKVVITRAERTAFEPLVADLMDLYPDLPAVIGPEPSVSEFAALWSRYSGRSSRPGMRQRIYVAQEILPPPHHPPGKLRAAAKPDFDTVVAWTASFISETRVSEPSDAATLIRDRIEQGGLFLWDADGPVSMAAWAGRTPTGVRVNLVFTPVEHRRKGYASSCTAQLSQYLLQSGRAFCCLFTDLANPTSNSIYQRIGYRAVCDMTDYILAV